eukprot:CAMPEP_0113965258 /NCGR_PEP_ID=MMETSP0011_2-20120614/7643_1 /TAXON_ID=101924 /ORGANISM="Rhodosorus marinus" /LENGTH=88 /DNA_ID=CAMNT_0000977747 /DNA_START=146 /DNA_END=412 /DNA_ORIENTATION=- /assembly_acc=CAM_ASM_000156
MSVTLPSCSKNCSKGSSAMDTFGSSFDMGSFEFEDSDLMDEYSLEAYPLGGKSCSSGRVRSMVKKLSFRSKSKYSGASSRHVKFPRPE